MIAVRKGKTKITIDYSKCGPDGVMDPRECTKCLKQCDRPVFHLHHVIVDGDDPWDPSYWQVTPVYTSQCTRCMRCIEVCTVNAISVSWQIERAESTKRDLQFIHQRFETLEEKNQCQKQFCNTRDPRDFKVSNSVLDGPQSIAFDQAENRMHAQKAVMALTMKQLAHVSYPFLFSDIQSTTN